jgi:hypothetical protein
MTENMGRALGLGIKVRKILTNVELHGACVSGNLRDADKYHEEMAAFIGTRGPERATRDNPIHGETDRVAETCSQATQFPLGSRADREG